MINIRKPKAEIWTLEGLTPEENDAHVSRCARVCYASERDTNNAALVKRLVDNNHLSMFRHLTHYFCIPLRAVIEEKMGIIDTFLAYPELCPYVRVKRVPSTENPNSGWIFLASNGQFVAENPNIFSPILKYAIAPAMMANRCPELLRVTVKVRTQISTTRELNRVSPNNIAEESTRYCNYSLDRFNGKVSLCQPHWFNLWETGTGHEVYPEDEVIQFSRGNTICPNEQCPMFLDDDTKFIVGDKEIPFDDMGVLFGMYGFHYLYRYLTRFDANADDYIKEVTQFNIQPQDARGLLHLDTCTNVVYTYFLDEWLHIFDLRIKGTTGKPHPNASLIMKKVWKLMGEHRLLDF